MRHKTLLFAIVAIAAAAPTGAAAQFMAGGSAFAGRPSNADPEEHLSRLAAASTPQDAGHGKPSKSSRTILKDDPYLRAAFGFLDNK